MKFKLSDPFKVTLSFRVFAALAVLGLAGCSHGHTRGTVSLKHSDHEADVCMGEGEVKPGDRVSLYRSDCTEKNAAKGVVRSSCKKVKIGDGEITQNIDEHFSTMKVDGKVPFGAGTIVEKD